jgi:hypothetical protein
MVEVPKGRFTTFLGNAKGALGEMFGKDKRGVFRGKSKDRREKLVEMGPIDEASGSDDMLVVRRLPQEQIRVGYRGAPVKNTDDPWYKGIAQIFPTFGKKKIQPQDRTSLIELEAIEYPHSVKGKSKGKGMRARVDVGLRMSDLAVEEAARKRGAAAIAEDAARSGFLPGGIPGTSVSRRVGRVKSTGKKTKKKYVKGSSSGSTQAKLLGIMASSSSSSSRKAAPVRLRVAAPAAASVVRSRIAPSIAGPAPAAPAAAASVVRPASIRRSSSSSPWSSSSSSAKRKKGKKIKVVIRPAGAGAAAAPIPFLFPPP